MTPVSKIRLRDARITISPGAYGLDECLIEDVVPGVPRALLKLKICSVCEVFGYALARLMHVNVPREAAVWTDDPEPVVQGLLKHNATEGYAPGCIGLLIEWHEDWRGTLCPWGSREVDWKELGHNLASHGVHFDGVTPLKQTVARALALCTFDRHEWGEFAVAGGQLYFFDLERLFPLTLTFYTGSTSVEDYRAASVGALDEVFTEARALGIKAEMNATLRDLCAVPPDVYRDALTIMGHPKAQRLSTIALRGFVYRRNIIARALGAPVHPIPPNQ